MGVTTAAIEADLTTALATIRRAWPREDDPATTRGRRRPPGPRLPGGPGITIRTACAQDLQYWVRAADGDGVAPLPADGLGHDVTAYTGHLLSHARALSGWDYAERMAAELTDHARALEQLTKPPEPTVRLGPCPREIVRPDDTREACGGIVRASTGKPSDVRCPGCGHIDTVEGWQRAIVGELGHVTAEDLAVRLRAIGIRTSADGVRMRVRRGSIPDPVGTDERGRHLWDAEAVLVALMAREKRAG